MTMRTIPPLDAESWDKLMAMMEKGPSEKQIEAMKKAREVGERYKMPG